MKKKELSKLDNQIKEKQEQLEELNNKIKTLEICVNKSLSVSKRETIDISNVYVLTIDGVNYFVHMTELNFFNPDSYIVRLANIFNKKEVIKYNCPIYKHAVDIVPIKHIRKVFNEVNVYPDGRVPKSLLQYLYYKANNIDSNMIQNVLSLKPNN